MKLINRIKQLEAKLLIPKKEIYWLMWRDCEWAECEGLRRSENESIESFKERILNSTDKQFIWVK
jgi:hypothetical protein